MLLSGECVISSVLSHHCKDLKRWTNVTAELQLRVLSGKQRKVHPQGMRAGDPKGKALASSFCMFCLLPPSLPYANWASQEGGVFVSPEVLTPVHGFSFVPFSQAFLFVF